MPFKRILDREYIKAGYFFLNKIFCAVYSRSEGKYENGNRISFIKRKDFYHICSFSGLSKPDSKTIISLFENLGWAENSKRGIYLFNKLKKDLSGGCA